MLLSVLFESEGFPTFKLSEDSFVHFTLEERANQIIRSGFLLSDPPYKKMGIVGVQAVSTQHGSWSPGAQSQHIETNRLKDEQGEMVAVWFKTNVLPKIGYAEEVIWNEGTDVPLINPRIIAVHQAKAMLDRNGEDVDTFFYAQ